MARSYVSRAEPKPASFEIDGVEFETLPKSIMDMAEWMSLGGINVASPKGLDLLNRILSEAVRDYDGFRAHCAEHGTQAQVLVQILEDIFIDAIGPTDKDEPDPTGRPGVSADGPLSTPGMSRGGSSSLVLPSLDASPSADQMAQVRLWLAEAALSTGG